MAIRVMPGQLKAISAKRIAATPRSARTHQWRVSCSSMIRLLPREIEQIHAPAAAADIEGDRQFDHAIEWRCLVRALVGPRLGPPSTPGPSLWLLVLGFSCRRCLVSPLCCHRDTVTTYPADAGNNRRTAVVSR